MGIAASLRRHGRQPDATAALRNGTGLDIAIADVQALGRNMKAMVEEGARRGEDPEQMDASVQGQASPGGPPGSEFLPPTAYAVLGLLSTHDEELSPSEIKVRADWSLKNFYWSPAVSHIRRELKRLVESGYVEAREIPISNTRTSLVYQTTDEGEQALARWVVGSPTEESVVVKNSMLLKVYVAEQDSEAAAIAVIDARLAEVDEAIRLSQWGLRRTVELGITGRALFQYPKAVSDYVLRSMYFEQSNLRQLRDTIVGFNTESFSDDHLVRRLPIRPRRKRPRAGTGE